MSDDNGNQEIVPQSKEGQEMVALDTQEVARWRAVKAKQLERIMDKLADKIEKNVGDLKVGQAFIPLAIMLDKHRDLTNVGAPVVANQTNIQINGLSREDALALLGTKTSRNLTADPIKVAATPVTEVKSG